MTIKKRIENKKLRYDINREAEKTSALSPSKIDKYEYLTVEETLRSYQSKVIVLAKFTYFLANICWSPRRLEARLQHKNFWSCECFFRTSFKTSWRRLPEVLETNKMFTWKESISVSKISKSVSDKSLSNKPISEKSKANPRQI